MLYKVINFRKLRFQRKILICFLITSLVTTYSSCTTTEMFYVTPESIQSGSQGEVTKIELKNGIKINCKNKLVKIENKYDTTGVIIISSPDTVKTGNNSYSVHWTEQRIPERDVLKIQME